VSVVTKAARIVIAGKNERSAAQRRRVDDLENGLSVDRVRHVDAIDKKWQGVE
jgi:hypothetical protein